MFMSYGDSMLNNTSPPSRWFGADPNPPEMPIRQGRTEPWRLPRPSPSVRFPPDSDVAATGESPVRPEPRRRAARWPAGETRQGCGGLPARR